MTAIDSIGFTGVSLLLLAYFFNMTNKLEKNSLLYLQMNFFGAGLACFASILMEYWPFIILEGCWTIVSAYGIVTRFKK